MTAVGRRWTEREAPAPIDLRLAPPALAVWAGCLIALWAAAAAWWVCAAAVAAAALSMAATRPAARPRGGRFRWVEVRWSSGMARGTAVALVCLAAGAAVAALRVEAAAADPLMHAAVSGDWVSAEVVVTGDPAPVRSPFPVADGGGDPAESSAGHPAGDSTGTEAGYRASNGRDTGRWRISARSTAVTTRGSVANSDVAVTVFGAGPAWSAVVTGQRVRIAGVAAADDFAVIPGAVVRVSGPPVVIGRPGWWTGWAVAVRASLARSAHALPADEQGLLRGLVVGDTRAIPAELTADAKTTGLTHLVAVSGSHVAMVCGLILLLLRRTGPRVSAVAAALMLAALVVLVGPQPSVLRAVVMGAIGMAAAVLGRARSALPGLAAAVFGLLLAQPDLAASVGFALSVQATAGLVLLAPAWTAALVRRGVPRGWAQMVVLPVAAQITTMPVIASIAGTVSLAAVPANIAVAPVVAPAMLLGLASAVTGPWWPAAGALLARLDGPLLGWISGTAHRLARWPDATVPWPATPAGVLALAALTVAALLVLRHRRVRAVALAACAGSLVVLLPAHQLSLGWPQTGWLLTACEVGQGDGMVLSIGSPGAAVVVDTGPEPARMDSCLDRLGITTIPLLVLTHLHADHVGGLAGALAGRSVGAIGVGPDREPADAWRTVTAAAAGRGIPVVALRPGSRWHSGDLTLDVLAPAAAYHGTDSDPNNDSVVMMATDRGVRILMAGDVERAAQQALLDSGVDLHADVLKQPHHGSAKLLPAFLAAVSPRVAVIGVGAGNDYGHPSPTALRADAAAGVAVVLRTDTEGDVQVGLTDGGLVTAARGRTLAPGT